MEQRYSPPRDVRYVRCLNCGDEGHVAQGCKKPEVEFRDRPCFNCGESGHTSRNCPKAKPRPGKAMAVEPAAEPISINMLEEHDGEAPPPAPCQDACCAGGFSSVGGGDPEDVEKSIGYAYRTDSRDHNFSETAWAACSRSWRLEMLLKIELEFQWLLR